MNRVTSLYRGVHHPKHEKRAQRIEWEHVVPAENFGRAFDEWREGSPECVDNRGKAFKGRRCAEKTSMDYRYMQADMYNLYPAIGAVNAMRSNFNFQMLPGEESSFGSCAMKIADRKVEPPALARGQIARTYFYMQDCLFHYTA
jgi:deoxyribonuclease-1